MTIYEKRRARLLESMKSHGIQAAVFTPSTDYRYLTGSKKQPVRESPPWLSPRSAPS